MGYREEYVWHLDDPMSLEPLWTPILIINGQGQWPQPGKHMVTKVSHLSVGRFYVTPPAKTPWRMEELAEYEGNIEKEVEEGDEEYQLQP